ncbi:nuclear transport factor 2 family protein [Spirosoma spitsbergense]|uniref:nuclear transport factor 2 family protein n=1 Tax=Spirosoma spitsbergense TaxID=431554 RepID=UPI00037900E3|nr:nuclear transport factor 2 family protein [Spirosoma spitsbergense]
MKTNILALALLLMSAACFAQVTANADVETALSQFLTEYNQSPYDFFKKRSTDDFRYIDRQGAFVLKPALLKSSEGRPSIESSASDLKIIRLGDLAVVSGIHSFGKEGTAKTAFTYTLKKEGKGAAAVWKFAASQHTPILGNSAPTNLLAEFLAMMKARNADPEGWLRTHTTPDLAFIGGHDGSLQNKDWMLGLFKTQKSQTADLTDVKVQQVGDLAISTGISTIKAVGLDGSSHLYKDAFTYTHRWINGQWMITNVHHTKIDYN